MSVQHDSVWIGKYQIQPRGKNGRAITIPAVVASEVGDSVVVWQGVEADNGTAYLRFALDTVSASGKMDEDFIACQSVVSSGRGARVRLPNECDEKHFPVEGHVGVSRGYSDGELTHLKIIPEQTLEQAFSAMT